MSLVSASEMNKCINCYREIDSRSKRCQKCYHFSRRGVKRPEQSKKMTGKRNPMFGTHRIGLNKGNKHPHLALYNRTHPKKGKLNGMYDKHHTEKTKQKIGLKFVKRLAKVKKGFWKNVKHHIYGKEYSDKIKMTRSFHFQLHHTAYFYILDKYGKEGIDAYLIWFKKKFHPKLFRRI